MIKKTVYLLGAGFSIPCGAPLQSKLIEHILALPKVRTLKPAQIKKIRALLDRFINFSKENLLANYSSLSKMALEDIFTPLDRCIAEDISFRDIEPKQLIEIREGIYTLIAAALSKSINKPHAAYIEQFVDKIVAKASIRTTEPKEDNVAIISTNWDIILDNALQVKLDSLKKSTEDFAGVVDYCCYMSSLRDNKKIKPGLFALGRGKFNVKLLKIHGSMNWHLCPRCQRLYVDFYKDFQGLYLIEEHHCSHCKKNFADAHLNSIRLRTNLIMPTFLKDLNNFQIKLIWQNAGIELSEADEVVFIGYSLPQADFELRQLLSRMVRKDVKIRVVLSSHDKPTKGLDWFYAGHRYKTFFNEANLNVTYEGVEEYVKSEMK